MMVNAVPAEGLLFRPGMLAKIKNRLLAARSAAMKLAATNRREPPDPSVHSITRYVTTPWIVKPASDQKKMTVEGWWCHRTYSAFVALWMPSQM
jgi:hypothetical protein